MRISPRMGFCFYSDIPVYFGVKMGLRRCLLFYWSLLWVGGGGCSAHMDIATKCSKRLVQSGPGDRSYGPANPLFFLYDGARSSLRATWQYKKIIAHPAYNNYGYTSKYCAVTLLIRTRLFGYSTQGRDFGHLDFGGLPNIEIQKSTYDFRGGEEPCYRAIILGQS